MAKKAEQQLQKAQNIESNGIYVLMDQINHATCRDAIKWIMNQNLSENPLPQLTLIINSPGGDVHAAFALIDTMKASSIPIKTVGLGLIASCGFLIFIAGTKGMRYVGKNTGIMNHQHTDSWESKMHDMRAAMSENINCETRALNIIKDAADISLSEARERFNSKSDQYFTAKQLLDLNLADKIL